MGFFLKCVGIAFRLVFHLNLQYPNLYLPLLTRMLGFHYNTYIRTYLYKLEFWGMIAIPTLVLTFTNWDFGAYLQYLHLTLILSLSLCFCISHFLCLLLGNNNNLCAILDFMCVLNTWCSKNLRYDFLHTKLILKENS
jgi:hypothetical protein